MYVSLTLVALAEGNHSVRFDRLIGEDLEPFLSEKNFFSLASAQPSAWNSTLVVVVVRSISITSSISISVVLRFSS